MTDRILRFPSVRDTVGLSHSTIYSRIAEGTFPKPVSLGGRAVGWLESEIEAWIQSKRATDEEPSGAPHDRNPAQINRPLHELPCGRFERPLR
jgi:prophage regulatory protein